jgi:hypothetical protein
VSSEEHGAAPGSQPAPHNERAPLGSWARVYVTVLAALAIDIALLWWLTERYR